MVDTPETMVSDLPVGTMLGKYEVLRKIATGGMAEIYLARLRGHAGFEKLVVVKRILPSAAEDPRLIQMFLDEARLVATLQHPNIADVHEVGEDRGAPFFVMEHIHGEDVRTIRHAAGERQQGVPLRLSLAIIHAIASALDYAHARKGADGKNLNLIHRDISTSNMLVSYQGAIKLIDFGVARVTKRNQTTQAGTVKGKVPYMSPEQCQGYAMDRRSDLFSLGVVMYELTVGQRPFQAPNDFDLMRQIVHTDARRPTAVNDGYPARLEKIVMKLLARKPEARYRTGEELLQELEPFMDHHQLWVPPKKISRYMQSLFKDRVAAWEAASRGDVKTFVEHVALATPERKPGDTPPTPLPIVMRLSQEIQAVALDSEASIAHIVRPGADPLDSLDDAAGGDSIALKPGGDTVTIRTGESELYGVPAVAPPATAPREPVDAPDPEEPSGDTITQPPGASVPAGDTITQPPGAPDVLSGDTITVKPVPVGAGIDPTAAAIAANRPRTGGSYQVRPERASTATDRTAGRTSPTHTPARGARVATEPGVAGPRTPVSGVRVPRLETSNEVDPPMPPPREQSGGVVSMWRPASVVSRQPTATGEGDGDAAAVADGARERLRSDADAVADALGAPSMIAAIDALGSFDENAEGAGAAAMSPATAALAPPMQSGLPGEETWDQPGTTPHARAQGAYVQASSSSPLSAPMLRAPSPLPLPLATPALASSVGPPLVPHAPASTAPSRNRVVVIVIAAIALAVAVAAAIVLAP